MKKKTMVTLCAALLAVCLVACGKSGQDGGSGDAGQGSTEETSTESEPVESTPEESVGDGDASLDNGEVQPGEDAGAGSAEEGWSQEMTKLKSAVVDKLEGEYFPDMAMTPDMLEMTFGITSDMYDDYMAEMPMISANVDTLLIVRAKDDKVEAVGQALEAYRDVQINDAIQYPMNIGKVQASRIETIGNYVIFVQLGGDTQQAAEEGDEAVIAMCQEINDAAIEAIRGELESGQ